LARHHHDFYQIDPLLFSAAQVELYNIDTGHRFQYGQLNPALLAASWGQP
jgi:methenyltetrahydromethanopterin cyclohydrolase